MDRGVITRKFIETVQNLCKIWPSERIRPLWNLTKAWGGTTRA